jgi:hypothetical protein
VAAARSCAAEQCVLLTVDDALADGRGVRSDDERSTQLDYQQYNPREEDDNDDGCDGCGCASSACPSPTLNQDSQTWQGR